VIDHNQPLVGRTKRVRNARRLAHVEHDAAEGVVEAEVVVEDAGVLGVEGKGLACRAM
jgi:hypothetical protein